MNSELKGEGEVKTNINEHNNFLNQYLRWKPTSVNTIFFWIWNPDLAVTQHLWSLIVFIDYSVNRFFLKLCFISNEIMKQNCANNANLLVILTSFKQPFNFVPPLIACYILSHYVILRLTVHHKYRNHCSEGPRLYI